MIRLSHLSFRYPQSSQPALVDFNLEIQTGTMTLVTGASGSGKSTLLRCINGLIPHFSGGTISGRIEVANKDPISEGPEALASEIGFVFQEPESQFVFDEVEDEIAFALENAGMPRPEMHARVDAIIEKMDLAGIRHRKIHHISGGEKQKVAIASALVTQPKILVLDEPTSQLDPASADEILRLIISLKVEQNLTVLISEHRLERLLAYVDHIAHITPDHHLAFGPPQEILEKMSQVPPLIQIAKQFGISPLPLTTGSFPLSVVPSLTGTPRRHFEFTDVENTPALAAEHLSVSLAGQQVLDDLTFQLNCSEILTLIGPNGAGKTTLLRALLGLTPYEGQKRLFGDIMDKAASTQVIEQMGYLPQNPNDLLFAESIQEELKITLKNHGLEPHEIDIPAFLGIFGLADKMERYPRDLSVGERQRTALAAVTVHKPSIILLDEPTRGMDYDTKQALSRVLKKWRKLGHAILLVTHDVEFAATLADRVILLEEGKLVFNGSPRVAFTHFSKYRTQTAHLFPGSGWITPADLIPEDNPAE